MILLAGVCLSTGGLMVRAIDAADGRQSLRPGVGITNLGRLEHARGMAGITGCSDYLRATLRRRSRCATDHGAAAHYRAIDGRAGDRLAGRRRRDHEHDDDHDHDDNGGSDWTGRRLDGELLRHRPRR